MSKGLTGVVGAKLGLGVDTGFVRNTAGVSRMPVPQRRAGLVTGRRLNRRGRDVRGQAARLGVPPENTQEEGRGRKQ